ncbi:translocation/assembly module TamB domain-containing protein [Geminisphaera colitermitum]|uniref:translocation/assembly module TamB domain-containing protein n=1 Tax=Geminisphaera colitermitum TaxID=1148786 RepID=UPI0018E37554|nr:translocation/assembly module TamB domain-containing protein [Geminisphaera colitermitum]
MVGRVEGGGGTVRIDAGAEPREGEGVPPVKIAIEAEGDRTQVAIRRLEVVLPQAEARLAEPFVMDWGGRFISGRSVFDFAVDLAALRAAGVDGLAGRVAGRAAFAPGPLSALVVDFSLSGRGLAWESQVIGDVAAEGEVRWPGIVLRKAGVMLDGGMVELAGRYDAATKSIADGVLSAALADESVVTRWIRAGVWPEGAGFGATKAAVRFSGTLPEALTPGALAGLRHEGELEAQAVRVPSAAFLKPLAVSVAWSGQGGAVDVSRLYFETNDKAAAWELAGKLRPAVAPGDADALTIGSWRWLRGGATWAELAVPVMVRRGGDVLVAVSPLRLVGGGEGSFSVSAEGVLQPGGGRVRLEAGNVTEDMLEDWLLSGAGDMAAWAKGASLASFLVEADWQGDGAVTGLARGEVRLEPLPGAPLAASFDVVANESVVELRKAEIRARGAVLADVQGRLPVTLHARREGWLQWREAEPFSVDLVSRDDVGWKEELAALSGIRLSGAELRASVSGTLREPGGTIRLRAGGLEIPENARERLPFSLPSVTDVRVEVALGKEGIRVEEASVKIDGQPVSMSGRLSVKSSEWMQLPQSWAELVRERAEGRLRITEARVASIARYMPTYLAPAGVLSADVAYGPHQRIEGLVTLHGASSRPLGPLGVLQQVEARIRFQGRSVVLESIKALAGGQPVMLTGGAEWPRGGRPVFDVRLRGENTPFVRQTGLVVRGDIDLTVRSLPGEPGRAKIGGEVRLRDSVFLSDLTSLMPTGVKGVARRPPYFAVEEAPFNAWELDVALRGERFMRVRSPVFEGVVSARFNLTGTLGNPRAVGEARVARGRVIFPFAVFVVQEGASVRLTEAAPYEPRLLVSGVAQRYDYDLRLELTGTAEAPVLQFFSSPALDSEQILMLVMAGVAPSESSLSTSTHRLARFGTYVGADMLRQLGVNDDAAERLTVRTGEKLSRQGKETYAMEYALGGRWSLVGEYDEFDGYNAGLKWRFTPRRKDEAGGGPVKQETETKGAETKEEVQP